LNMFRSTGCLLIFCCLALQFQSSWLLPFKIPDFGRWVTPTIGEVWPKPQAQSFSENFFVLRPNGFQFEVIGQRCDILDDALRRYYQFIFNPAGPAEEQVVVTEEMYANQKNFRAFLDVVKINLQQPCEQYPSENMVENYQLEIDSPANPLIGVITSPSIWGMLRGLETFSQLVYISPDGIANHVNATQIVDFPRFSHRGLLVDTARHYMPLKTLRKVVDLLAHDKMNVFHWHLVDDSAFPYQSTLFPELSGNGSYNPYSHVYTPADVRTVIEYARYRGVRVIPEFDMPGHAHAWFGIPGLLTQCHDDNWEPYDEYGPMNPARETTFSFLRRFLGEVFRAFPEKYIHIGGDEVQFYCWRRNPEVVQFMADNGWGTNWGRLEQYFIERVINESQVETEFKKTFIIWQEIIDDNATLPRSTIVQIWKDNYAAELSHVSKFGYPIILSSPWYLNYISYGLEWEKYYTVEPLDFEGTEEQKKLVIGGEAAMWSEYVDAVNMVPRTWPRLSVVAERLWSDRSVNNTREAVLRLEEHRCRLLRRGYNVNPVNGPNFCPKEWDQ